VGIDAVARQLQPRVGLNQCHVFQLVLPFGRLWYAEPNAVNNAIGYAKFYSRSHDAVICVYDEASNLIEMHEQAGAFKAW
jgi:hypothetical protein